MKIYLSTDLHLGHENIIYKFEFRDKNFSETSRLTHQRALGLEKDYWINLGDVAWEKFDLKTWLEPIKARKILCLGNHDKKSVTWYLNQGFDFVCESFILNKIEYSHKPMFPRSGIKFNIHGHFHHEVENPLDLYPFYTKTYHKLLLPKPPHYGPIELNKFLARGQ